MGGIRLGGEVEGVNKDLQGGMQALPDSLIWLVSLACRYHA